jgi:hypothetical protein
MTQKDFALFLEPTPEFHNHKETADNLSSKDSAFKFLSHYFIRCTKNYLEVIIMSMLVAVRSVEQFFYS